MCSSDLRLEAATVAFVEPGNRERDQAFNQQGENTSVARVEGRTGRGGRGWFSYDLPFGSTPPATLVVTYHADQRRERTFEIFVDGARVGEQTLARSTKPEFFDVEYPMPPDLIAGKSGVTVRFEATGGNEMGPVFGIRLIRAR